MSRPLLLRPRFAFQVTVWATEQEDPAKTWKKWRAIEGLEALAGEPHLGGEPGGPVGPSIAGEDEEEEEEGAEEEGRAEGRAGSGEGAGGVGGTSAAEAAGGNTDFFVPWHLPCYRAEAHGAMNKASGQQKVRSGALCLSLFFTHTHIQFLCFLCFLFSCLPHCLNPSFLLLQVDASKGAVVFQRYYHLFTKEELEGLVLDLPGARLVDCFYDKSNWCIVFEREA
jgi:hypothetical protein